MGKRTNNGKSVIKHGNQLGVHIKKVGVVPPNLAKRVANHMIVMRFSGKSQQECDEWLENFIQEIERIEKENRNG